MDNTEDIHSCLNCKHENTNPSVSPFCKADKQCTSFNLESWEPKAEEDDFIVDDPYLRLRAVMQSAINQAEHGKGKERHAVDGENFEDQKIVEISKRLSGHVAGGPLFQVVKKVYESGRLDKQAAIRELYGAMNYLAAAIIVVEDKEDDQHD